VIIDNSMSFSHHISNIGASAFSYLIVIGHLCRSLSYADCLMLSHSLVISRILCNLQQHLQEKTAASSKEPQRHSLVS
jgi:hypothetical protein